jgi:hypothetical protein
MRLKYPEIEEISIDAKESGTGMHDHGGYHFDINRMPEEIIPCSFKLCDDGGFDIQSVLDKLVLKRETEYNKGISCKGVYHVSKRAHLSQSCSHFLSLDIKIKYKFPK